MMLLLEFHGSYFYNFACYMGWLRFYLQRGPKIWPGLHLGKTKMTQYILGLEIDLDTHI